MNPRALLRPGARLYHVTDAASWPLIQHHGLMSASRLVALFGGDPDKLSHNRDGYVTLSHPEHGQATLRRQYLRDETLSPRLASDVTCEAYRRFINAHVYFWPRRRRADALDRFEAERAQIVLSLPVEAVVSLGTVLLASPINGGGVFDRQMPALARRRHPGLYRPLSAMTERVVELAVEGGLPPGLDWRIEPSQATDRSTANTPSP